MRGVLTQLMRRKDKSVSLVGLQPEMRAVLTAVDSVYSKYGKEPVITAGTEAFNSDGKLIHSVGSLHPFGYALDFRTNYFEGNNKGLVAHELRKLLGPDYDVILHASHMHIEFDKK
jgi:hypothetical protein